VPDFEPPHDCRVTHRCLKTTFQFRLPLDRDFASLRSENSVIEKLFELRENDPRGGEGGERVRQIRCKPAFKLTSGRMRGATWFDRTRRPQGIVWLLGAEMHDERHKGRRDAYDILGHLDARLLPEKVDYLRLELDRRRRDTESFATDLVEQASSLYRVAAEGDGRSAAEVVHVPVRVVVAPNESDLHLVFVAVSSEPVIGPLSGMSFALTQERFALITEGFRQAIELVTASTADACEVHAGQFPGGLNNERGILVMFGA
jgi:hypothetical protein